MKEFKCNKLVSSLIFALCVMSFISLFSVNGYADELDDKNDLISIHVLFRWEDNDDVLQLRPEKMIAKLYANGDFTSKRVVADNRTWHGTFTDLPIYDEEGSKIEYTVVQQYLPNANTSYEYTYRYTMYDESSNTYIITNKYIENRVLDKDEIKVDMKDNIYRDPLQKEDIEVLVDDSTLKEYHENDWQKDGIEKYDSTPKTSDVYDILKYVYMIVATSMTLLVIYIYRKESRIKE